jgi:hypothetical protein
MAKHLTPDERAAIVARYVETANASQVAREFGVNETTVRKSVARARELKKSEFHARACARAVREGRRTLSKTAKRLKQWLEEHGDPMAPTMEPGDVSKMATALRGIISGVIEVDEHRNRSALSRLTRELRRKEIELAALKIAAGGVERHEVAVVSPELAAAAAREVFGSPSALETNGPARDTSAAPLEVDALPLPSPVDHRAK